MAKEYKLPSMEHRFGIQTKGDDSGINWVGDFTFKRPTIGAKSQIEVLTSRLNGDLANLNSSTQDLNYTLAYLRYTLTEFPDWWRESEYGTELYDLNVIMEIYDHVTEFEKEWKEKFHGNVKSNVNTNAKIKKDEPVNEEDTKESVGYQRTEGE